MRRLVPGFVALAVLAISAVQLSLVASSAQEAAKPAGPALVAEDFLFMSGSWQLGSGANLTEEHWTLPNAGSLIGMSRTIRGGKTTFFEFLRLEQGKDGVDYVAQPGGRFPPTRFRCTSLEGKKAVFENTLHDFPTRITYERTSDDELIAIVSGPPNGKEKPQTLRFTRGDEGVRLPD